MNTAPSFATAEGLRLLLVHLHYAGPRAWQTDPDAAELMAFTMRKYSALAHRHGVEPADAAVAAFEVMRTRAARVADDPWAVVTHAVQLSLIYEARAHGLLCSPQQARRPSLSGYHDAERFSDHETDLADYHPALHVEDDLTAVDDPQPNQESEPTNAYVALDAAVAMFVELGWPQHAARIGLEYIAARLIRTGSRHGAFESLRRDRHAQALLDIHQEAWLQVLRAVLGNQHPDRVHTSAGRGMFLRLLIGQQPNELFADAELADAVESAAPAADVAGDRHV